jgi:serine protease AprX
VRGRPYLRVRPSRLLTLVVAFLVVTTTTTAPAHAGLLGLVGGVVDTTLGLVGGILSPGWDDGATTAPVRMPTVAAAVGADDLWARGIDGRGVGVALIDTGVVPVQGLDGAGKVVNGPDLSFESQADELRYLDGYGHGTHMAGIIAGNDGAGGSFKGVAPGARLLNMRVATHDGAVDVTQVVAAIDWVVQHRNDNGMNVRVINLSYGTDSVQDRRLDPLSFAVENAWRKGIVVVTGAGNDGDARPILSNPAVNPFVLAVGAVDLRNSASASDDIVAPFSGRSSTGRTVDVVAPGVSLTSLRDPGSLIDTDHPGAVVEDRFFRGSGTSQATAVTSGAVALLLQARPSLTPDQVKAVLRSSATSLSGTSRSAQGAGRIDVNLAALSLVPFGSTQSWGYSTGAGSLEAARGSSHVADDGVELTGELDIFGQPWNGAAWAAKASAGTAWSGGSWNGSDWTGTCWCATSWAGTSWNGRTWIGDSWTGRTWIGRTWIGRTWIGRTWIGDDWSGRTWIGRTWIGRTWLTPQ